MTGHGLLALSLAYLVGAIPFGLLAVRIAGGGDIREGGSGNVGATNAFRTGGRGAGIATLVLDIAKGAAAVLLARGLMDPIPVGWEATAALAAVTGHCFPVFLRFKGGKGIATGCGAYGLVAPVPVVGATVAFLALLLTTRMVSVGSIGAGVALLALIAWDRPDTALLASAGASVLLVIVRHRANIGRIVAGKESRIGSS